MIMKLYHGTNTDILDIQLNKCLPNKDFGRGFYLTPDRKRAKLRALDKVYKTHEGIPTVIAYDFNKECLKELKTLSFDGCNEEWLDFILYNRSKRNTEKHDYDIVIGPVADDGVITSISLYESRVIGKEELLKRLQEVHPYTQYTFCTQKAIDKLQRI